MICSLVTFSSHAQSNNDEVNLIQSVYGMEKKQLVSDYMKLTETEASKFWAVYDEYETTRKELGKKRIDNIAEYAKNYESLSDTKATELVNSTLAIHIAFAKLQEKTFKKMSTVISPVRAAQFIQLEVYLENVVRSEISDEIPLIGELEKMKK